MVKADINTEIDSGMVSFLAWQKITLMFSSREFDNLSVFGEKYGQSALEQKFLSMIKSKSQQNKISVLDIFIEAEKTAALFDNSKKDVIPSRRLTLKKRDKNLEATKVVVAPLTHGLFTLKFWTDVVEPNFLPKEQEYWQKRLINDKDDKAFLDFGRAMEQRLGKPFDQIVSNIKFDVSNLLHRVIKGSISELRSIVKNNQEEELTVALNSRDIATSASIFRKNVVVNT